MDEKTISEAIKKVAPVLQKGNRVELIPTNGKIREAQRFLYNVLGEEPPQRKE